MVGEKVAYDSRIAAGDFRGVEDVVLDGDRD